MSRQYVLINKKVRSAKKAFEEIEKRLQADVGTLIALIRFGQSRGYFNNTAPFWALARMLFPIAESLGSLLLAGNSSANLKYGLDLLGDHYQGISALISLIYRHSLMHQDELRTLKIIRTRITWHLTFDDPNGHLKVTRFRRGLYEIMFDLTQFYSDLLNKLKNPPMNNSKRQIRSRYNNWLELELTGANSLEREALNEIEAFRKLRG